MSCHKWKHPPTSPSCMPPSLRVPPQHLPGLQFTEEQDNEDVCHCHQHLCVHLHGLPQHAGDAGLSHLPGQHSGYATNRDTPSAGQGRVLASFMVCPHTGDLLNNYCDSDPVANVARAVYTLIIMLTYPIELHVTREVTALRVE